MARLRLTRAQRRERRANVPLAGVYGVDADDAEAQSWTGLYLFHAASPTEAKARIREAGFHRKQIKWQWSPEGKPPELPPGLGPGDGHWYRSRLDDDGWTPW